MQLDQSVQFTAEAATAWMAYQTFVRQLVEARQLTIEAGERLCGALGQDKWYLGYQRERVAGLTQPIRFAM